MIAEGMCKKHISKNKKNQINNRDSWITSESGEHVQRLRCGAGVPPSLTRLGGPLFFLHVDPFVSFFLHVERICHGVAVFVFKLGLVLVPESF